MIPKTLNHKKTWVTFIILLVIQIINAQEHVFTKSLNKTFDVAEKRIIVDAEKATININKSNTNKIEIQLKLISKHTNKEISENQLKYLKHVVNTNKKEVYLRNYILIPANEELAGSIEAIYDLSIPDGKTITIKNSLGNIEIKDLTGIVSVDVKYGKVKLDRLDGELNLSLHVGESVISNCNLKAVVFSKYASINFRNNIGNYLINSNLGSINFRLNKEILALEIDAKGTEINLINKDCVEFNWTLESTEGNILIDKCSIPNNSLVTLDNRQSNAKTKTFNYQSTKTSSVVIVKNNYANISIF